jgi:excisionase family DNA binding protein
MTNQETTWMTIREAALALAVSELTVRRRIKDGRLRHQLVNGKYFVDLQSSPGMLGSGEDSDHRTEERRGRDVQATPRMISRASQRPPTIDNRHSLDEHDTALDALAAAVHDPQFDDRPPATGFNLDALLLEHARLAEIAGRATLLQNQYAELTARHEELQSGMLSLAGRNGWLESKLEERESEIKLLTDQQPQLSWWKRLFRS